MCALVSGVMVIQALTRNSIDHALNVMVVNTQSTPDIAVNQQCPELYGESSIDLDDVQLYWDGTLVRSLRHAFYLGFLLAPVPAGLAADLYGVRYVCAASLLLTAACVLLLPSLAVNHPHYTVPSLLVLGLSNGATIPCLSVVTAHWAPEVERCTFAAFIECGHYIGWIIVEFFHERWRGWGSYSWMYGSAGLGVSWCVLWLLLFYDRPVYHPHITQEEYIWINSHTAGVEHGFVHVYIWMLYSPWKYIFLSVPFLALLSIAFCSSWAQYVIMSEGYLQNVLNIKNDWGVSATGQIGSSMVVSALVHGVICDWLVKHKYMTFTASRRIFAVLSTCLPVPFIMTVTFWNCNLEGVLVTLTVALYLCGMGKGVLRANTVDLSPQHCGVLSGLDGALTVVAGMISSVVKGMLVDQHIKSPDAWTGVFWVTGLILLLMSLPYACLGSGQIQPWNNLPTRERFSARLSRLRASQGGRETTTSVATHYLDRQQSHDSAK